MIELIKHSLGLCGENHPNIITILFGGTIFLPYIKLIVIKLKNRWKEA